MKQVEILEYAMKSVWQQYERLSEQVATDLCNEELHNQLYDALDSYEGLRKLWMAELEKEMAQAEEDERLTGEQAMTDEELVKTITQLTRMLNNEYDKDDDEKWQRLTQIAWDRGIEI